VCPIIVKCVTPWFSCSRPRYIPARSLTMLRPGKPALLHVGHAIDDSQAIDSDFVCFVFCFLFFVRGKNLNTHLLLCSKDETNVEIAGAQRFRLAIDVVRWSSVARASNNIGGSLSSAFAARRRCQRRVAC
jgi:hypothetical protein